MEFPEIPERFLKIGEVVQIFGIHKATVYRWIHNNGFPRPQCYSSAIARWSGSQIRAWCIARVAQTQQPAPSPEDGSQNTNDSA